MCPPPGRGISASEDRRRGMGTGRGRLAADCCLFHRPMPARPVLRRHGIVAVVIVPVAGRRRRFHILGWPWTVLADWQIGPAVAGPRRSSAMIVDICSWRLGVAVGRSIAGVAAVAVVPPAPSRRATAAAGDQRQRQDKSCRDPMRHWRTHFQPLRIGLARQQWTLGLLSIPFTAAELCPQPEHAPQATGSATTGHGCNRPA